VNRGGWKSAATTFWGLGLLKSLSPACPPRAPHSAQAPLSLMAGYFTPSFPLIGARNWPTSLMFAAFHIAMTLNTLSERGERGKSVQRQLPKARRPRWPTPR